MARITKTRSGQGSREGLRTRKKIEYNVQKLSDASVVVPEVPKKAAAAKKKGAKKKSGSTYLALIKKALRDVEKPGWGLETIIKHLVAEDPDRDNRRAIRLALSTGVDKKIFVKTRSSWRLSKKVQEKLAKKKKAAKKTAKKATKKATKKTATKKGTKKTTTKKGTKKATTKKTTKKTKKTDEDKKKKKKTTKKADADKKKKTTKKTDAEKKKKTAKKEPKKSNKRAAEEDAPKSPAKKKVIGPPASDESGPVLEAIGKWQYWDGGWQDYTDDGSRIVEGVFQEYKFDTSIFVRPIQSGHFSYSVNFQTLEQTNTQTGTMRKIRRI